jgi:hypothetical protein
MQGSMTIDRASDAKRWTWIALLTAASVVFSLSLACAAPFAAIATLAALQTGRRDALLATAAAWVANQTVGYGLLDYPQNFNSYAWGVGIGVAAMAGTAAAMLVADRLPQANRLVVVPAAFAAAFVVYQAALFAAGLPIGSGLKGFTPAIIGYVLQMNLLALVGLLMLHGAGRAMGLIAPRAAA